MKPDIILTTKIFARTQERLEKEFACRRLYEAGDRPAFLKEMSQRVRGLATFGAGGADAALMDALPKLEIISNFGVGVDAIDLDAAKKRRIIVTTKIFPPTQARLDREFTCHKLHEAPDRAAFFKELAPRVRGLATFGAGGADAALMDALPKLEIISNFGVGVDTIDLDAAKKRRIIVTNTPDVLNDCVADTAMALTVNVMRKFPQAEGYLRAGQWAAKGGYPLTTSLGGKVMGILGLGRIGEAIAQRAQAFGMKIRYHNRKQKDVAYPYDADAATLARNADVLMVVTPGGAQTDKLVNASVLDALGPQGYLVNIARGSVVDEPVLLKYLQEKRIAGAGLDVFADEPRVPEAFFTLDNAVLLPHVGSATVETRTAMGNLQVDNLLAHFAGKSVLTRVV